MSSCSDVTLCKKFSELNDSAQSIKQLSLWLIHHRKHAKLVVRVWHRELFKAPADKKLAFLYVANDVVQNSRKKTIDYSKEFGGIMKKVVKHLAAIQLESDVIDRIRRLLNIWKERDLFDAKIQAELGKIWKAKEDSKSQSSSQQQQSPVKQQSSGGGEPEQKKLKKESPKKAPSSASSTDQQADSMSSNGDTTSKAASILRDSLESNDDCDTDPALLDAEQDGSTGVEIGDPPDAEELISALHNLEDAASSDAVVREQIARLPAEVSCTSAIDALSTFEEGQELLLKTEKAQQLLKQYNERLQRELKDRKKVAKMIKDFLVAQKNLEAQAEEKLEAYKERLDKVNTVRNDLQAHMQSLPDLSKLPDVTGGLDPLPSAGDLFTVK